MHYNGSNSYVFANSIEIYKLKAKDSGINAAPSCLGNISKDFWVGSMKKTVLYGYVSDFNVDYDVIQIPQIIHSQIFIEETI